MSTPTGSPGPRLNLRGAVDLSSLGSKKPTPGAAAGSEPTQGASPWVIDVTEATIEQVILASDNVPVLVDLWAPWCEPCKKLTPLLEKVVTEAGGRVLLAKIDTEAEPGLATAFQVQSVPTVMAFIKRQPIPGFQGAIPEAQIRQLVDQLLTVAEQNGVTGVLPGAAPGDDATQQEAPAMPPLHQEAADALAAGDLTRAQDAYRKALEENPSDDDAKQGLARVKLLLRLEGVSAQDVRDAAANDPRNIDAVMAVADLDIAGGHVEDGLLRLIESIKVVFGDERNTLRERVVELFGVVGENDPRVVQARRNLASALF